jgi:hypothetical protein
MTNREMFKIQSNIAVKYFSRRSWHELQKKRAGQLDLPAYYTNMVLSKILVTTSLEYL